MGLPAPAVAGMGATLTLASSSSSGTPLRLTVESTVLPVSVLGAGTSSPGASLTGLPRPAVAGMGLMNWRFSVLGVGVMGNAPGTWSSELDLLRSFSLGTAPASAAVEDVGAAEESVCAGSSSTMFPGVRMLLTMPLPSSSLGALSLIHQLPLTTNYAPLLASIAMRAACSRARRQARVAEEAYLVLCLGLGKLDGLLEDAALLL